MSEYKLNNFIMNEKLNESTIKIDEKHIYKIKNNAWTYLNFIMIKENYKNDIEKMFKEIIKIFLGNEALIFINKNCNSVQGAKIFDWIMIEIEKTNKEEAEKEEIKK